MKMTEILKPKTENEIWEGMTRLTTNLLLFTSARVGFMPGVKKALEQGADIDYFIDFCGRTALATASEEGQFHVVKYLLDRDASVCDISLIGAFERMDLFNMMLERVKLKECELRIALEVAEDENRAEIANLIRERIKRG
jgi:ankyrin repeat protein